MFYRKMFKKTSQRVGNLNFGKFRFSGKKTLYLIKT